MLCELCGKGDGIYHSIIEGSSVVVCKSCKNFGKIVGDFSPVGTVVKEKSVFKKSSANIPSEEICPDFAAKIRTAREKLGKNHQEFAKFINEKISIIHKLETGQIELSLDLARKLERLLKIKLVEIVEPEILELPKEKKSESFTIGDFIKLKNK